MENEADLILGLDGGGTKTLLAVAARDGTVLLTRRSATVDPFAEAAWPDALAHSLASARPILARLAGAVLGLPCFGEVEDVSRRQQNVAQRLLPVRHDVVNDVQAAFTGALAGRPGILLLAGTGSMAWAGNGRREMRVGGWGDVFGDEGSAYWIGREALSAVGRALDGRSPHAGFARDLLERLDLRAPELAAWCYGQDTRRRGAIAGVARFVDASAEAGNAEAQRLLVRAGDHLADHAQACRTALGLSRGSAWSHAGGVFHSRTVMMRVTDRLDASPDPPRLSPVGGALLRAAQLSGWPADAAWIDRLHRALSTPARGADTTDDGEQL